MSEQDQILKILKDKDQHGLSISVSDDNAKSERKLTLKFRTDDTANAAHYITEVI